MWSISSLLGHRRSRPPGTRACGPRSRASHQRRPAPRLRVEELEDRVLLSAPLVKDINPAIVGSVPTSLTVVGDRVFFAASTPETGNELWVSDGTPEGTVVLDLIPGPAGSFPMSLTNVGGTLFFTARDLTDGVTHGRELWKSDGTPAGTMLVKDIEPGTSDGFPDSLTNVGGTLYFAAFDSIHGTELWKSDGTAEGTVLVKDIIPGRSGSSLSNLTDVGGTLFFTAFTPETGNELWKSDGMEGGTVLVKDINPGAGS